MTMLSSRSRLGYEILAAGVAGGIVGDALLRAGPWGINATLCVTALVAAGVILVRRHRLVVGPDAPWLAITALLLGAAFLRRDAEMLAVLDVGTLLVTLCLAAASLQGERIGRWFVFDYVRAGVTAAAGSIVGSLLLVSRDVPWREVPQNNRLTNLRAVLLGVLVATPLLIVFAALFASADKIFGNVLANLFSFDATVAVNHMFFFCFWAALVAGYFRWSLLGRPFTRPLGVNATLDAIPVATALGLLNALFLLFVVVQLRYFFGGASLVESTTGLTYAEYARQGFFQLVVASALVLPVLLGADWLLRSASTTQLRLFRQLAGLLLVLLVVIMASALERMRLYVGAFGLTDDRLYATAFMILLLGVFAWFSWTVLRGARDRFAFGALMNGLAVLAALHIVNPDALIVKTNLERPRAERPFDAKYALTLGADAVPHLLAALPRLPAGDRCIVVAGLLKRWDDRSNPAPDWRTWNWSRGRARQLVGEQAETLRAGCKDVT